MGFLVGVAFALPLAVMVAALIADALAERPPAPAQPAAGSPLADAGEEARESGAPPASRDESARDGAAVPAPEWVLPGSEKPLAPSAAGVRPAVDPRTPSPFGPLEPRTLAERLRRRPGADGPGSSANATAQGVRYVVFVPRYPPEPPSPTRGGVVAPGGRGPDPARPPQRRPAVRTPPPFSRSPRRIRLRRPDGPAAAKGGRWAGRRPVPRRPDPPPARRVTARWLARLQRGDAEVELRRSDGGTVRGRLVGFDDEALLVEVGTTILVFRSAVAVIRPAAESGGSRAGGGAAGGRGQAAPAPRGAAIRRLAPPPGEGPPARDTPDAHVG